MKKLLLIFVTIVLLVSLAGCSKLAKFKSGVTYLNLPEPKGQGGMIYGAVYLPSTSNSARDLQLRDIHFKNIKTGNVYGIDYTIRKKNKTLGHSYYIANVPAGKYILCKFFASGAQWTTHGFQGTTTHLKGLYHEFNKGTGKTFIVKKNEPTYVGNYFFANPSILPTLKKLITDKQIYNAVDSYSGKEVVIGDIYKGKEHLKFIKYLMIRYLGEGKPNSAWLTILKKDAPYYAKLDEEIGKRFIALRKKMNSFKLGKAKKAKENNSDDTGRE